MVTLWSPCKFQRNSKYGYNIIPLSIILLNVIKATFSERKEKQQSVSCLPFINCKFFLHKVPVKGTYLSPQLPSSFMTLIITFAYFIGQLKFYKNNIYG